MNEVWNLDPLYKGFDDPAFSRDMETLQNRCGQLTAFASGLETAEPLEGLRTGVKLLEEITALVDRLGAYPSLRQSINTRDNEAASQQGRVRALMSGIAGAQAAFQDWAGKLPDLMALVNGDESLRDYRFYFEDLRRSGKYLLEGDGEEIVARMSMSGTAAWNAMRGLVTSTAKVDYRGQTTNLSGIRNLARDPDAQVRKDAYEAELAAYEAIKDPVAHALNAIKLETISQCKLRGYESPLAYTLERAHVSRQTLDAMFGAIDEFLPKFWQYLKAKAKLLGHEGGLPWYDLFAPVGEAAVEYTPQTARDYLVALFADFDPEMSRMIATAFDEAWIDFYPRDGKRDGAFCSSVRSMGRSWILTNFGGSFGSVTTLAHELGHAYHNLCIRGHRILNKRYSMPVAETASTFNEVVIMSAVIAEAEGDAKMALVESQLQDTTQIICDIYSRYLFESAVFAERQESFLFAPRLKELMLEAQKKAYGDGLDPQYLHPYMWVCKGHYYSSGLSFYNFPYAFGGLFARGLYARYLEEGEAFLPKYRALLKATTVDTVENVASIAGIDLTEPEFWRKSLQVIADKIDEFIAETSK